MRTSFWCTLSWLLATVLPVGAAEEFPADVLNQRVGPATALVMVRANQDVGCGTGCLVRNDGETAWLVTSRRLVTPALDVARFARVEVMFKTSRNPELICAAEVVAADPERDLALLRVRNAKGLPEAFALTAKPNLDENQTVFVLGCSFPTFPGKLQARPGGTVFAGGYRKIASLRENARGQIAVVHVDGDIEPGCTGGPVVDRDGNLVGMLLGKPRGAACVSAVPARVLLEMLKDRQAAPATSTAKNVDPKIELPVIAPKPKIELPVIASKPVAIPLVEPRPIADIKVRSLAVVGVGNTGARLCWTADAKAFYHLDRAGVIRCYSFPDLKLLATGPAAGPLGRAFMGISLSSQGLIAPALGVHEFLLLDPVTLRETRKIATGGGFYVHSAPGLDHAYVCIPGDDNGELKVLDLRTGKLVQRYTARELAPAEHSVAFDHPVVSGDGQYLFSADRERIFRFKLDGGAVRFADATPRINLNFAHFCISNDGDLICAPGSGGNNGAEPYLTYIYSSGSLKQHVLALSIGQSVNGIGFDVKSGLIYSHRFDKPLMIYNTRGQLLQTFGLDSSAPKGAFVRVQFLVHPEGRRLLALTHGRDAKLYAVELLEKAVPESK